MDADGTGFGALMATLEQAGDAFATTLPEGWMQGRTTYGGLSAALCVEAARRALPGLPPLRSAQFAFAGPAAGRLVARPALVRQGRSAAAVAVGLDGEAGPAVRALLTYGAPRASAVVHGDVAAPDVPPPDRCGAFFPAGAGPRFAANFDMRLAAGARPMSGGEPAFALWIRHRDSGATDPLTALVALADALPPAATVAFARSAPISTMTWTLDLLGAPGDDAGAWRLLRSASEHAADGYSAQAMMLWDERGRPLCLGRQTVALFA